jgi:hypothetical protein
MPDDKTNGEDKTNEKIIASLEKLNQKIEEKSEKDAHRMSQIDAKVTALADEDEGEEDDTWNLSDDKDEDPDVTVKRSELKGIVDSAVKKATEKATKAATEVVHTEISGAQKKNEMDAKAFEEFPYLNSQSESHNPKFLEQVRSEMKRKVDSGRNPEDPEWRSAEGEKGG